MPRRHRRLIGLFCLLIACALQGLALSRPVCADDDAASRPSIRNHLLGSLSVKSCFGGDAYCGRLMRPLDPASGLDEQIAISFAWFPHRQEDIASSGVIVAVDGGPGYASTGSSDDFRALFAPLLGSHDLLIMDNRGTGRSGALLCPDLQAATRLTPAAVAACGAQLGKAAYAYRSSLAADDLAALLQAIGAGPIDLYGDSYGTYFAEVFAYRHPQDLRTLILDSAYPAQGGDPWWPEGAASLRRVLDAACSRSSSCAAQPATPSAQLRQLVAALQAPAGNALHVPLDMAPADLADVALSGALGPVFLREIGAAITASRQFQDEAPLQRLVAEALLAGTPAAIDPKPRSFSAGLFVAVSCSDYPQLYDMHLDPAQRQAALAAAVARRQHDHPDNYAPFSIADMRASALQENTIDLCLNWPVAPAGLAIGQPLRGDDGRDLPAPSVPTLILSGEFDLGTTVQEGSETAALFPKATQIILRNSFHANALDAGNRCAVTLVRDFVNATRLRDASCADRLPAVQLLPHFAQTLAAVVVAQPESGNAAERHDLQLANATALTAQDILARWWSNPSGSGTGLRGGHYHFQNSSKSRVVFTLHKIRWVADLAISGRLIWDRQSGEVKGDLELDGDDDDDGKVALRWNTAQVWGRLRMVGEVNGGKLVAAAIDGN
jgi:pimeloyl-ACP methyl ester carboxylesterase